MNGFNADKELKSLNFSDLLALTGLIYQGRNDDTTDNARLGMEVLARLVQLMLDSEDPVLRECGQVMLSATDLIKLND